MLVSQLFSLTLRNVEGRSEMRQIRKGGKCGREAISRVEEKHYKTAYESRQSVKYYKSNKVLHAVICSWKSEQACTCSFTNTKNLVDRDRSFIASHLLNFINQEWKLLSITKNDLILNSTPENRL